MRAPLPADEAERLRVLHELEVLDTAAEADFDDIVTLASRICGVPMSLVSLIDTDRQWIKAKVGTDATETTRDVSFCAHAILGRDLMVVPDARLDSRFADNPGVLTEPGVRFYAGAPLVTTDGYAVGTLCVVDITPHRLTLDQLRALRALARQVTRQLELNRYAATATRVSLRQWEAERRAEQVVGLAGGELRAPLADLVGYLDRLADGTLEPVPVVTTRDTARRHADALRRLIDGLAALAGPLGDVPLRMRTVDLSELVRRAVEAVRPVAHVKQVPVTYGGGGALPVHADPVRLDQALTHVLFNAVKYTPAGGRIEVVTDAEAGPAVRIQDHDLADGARPSLFAHFYRGAIARPIHIPGPDRGLAVAKQIFDAHHATLALCDQPGQGSALHLVFPPPSPVVDPAIAG